MTGWIAMLFGGGLAGTLGGLLGIGGGVVLMPLLRFLVGLPPATSAGTCILAVFFTTLGGSYRHHRAGSLRVRPLLWVIVAGVVVCVAGSLAFGLLASRGRWLDLGMGLVFSVVSLRMVLEGALRRPERGTDGGGAVSFGTPLQKVFIGAVAGGLPGLLGIGTGSILVPTFTFLLHTPVKAATAASLVCFCFTAAVSAAFKLAQGHVAISIAAPVCVGTALGANLGVVLNRRFSSNLVKVVFGLVFAYVSLKFIIAFTGATQ